MHVEMVDVEGTILREIADTRFKQKDVALTYAFGLRSSEEIDWRRVNIAIITRWSNAGLANVKRLAWQHFDAARAAATRVADEAQEEASDA